MVSLENQFSRDGSRHSEWLRQQKWFIKARKDHEVREELTDKIEGDTATMVSAAMVVATEEIIRDLEIKLDQYEEATVSALMLNQKQLDAVNAHIELLLSRAYVMDDGRRVFKTEDGEKVFDEFGQEVSPDEVDFELIGGDRPTWESYQSDISNRDRLTAERESLHTYQEELDGARERISEGGISEAELEELDAELMDLMPSPVREQIPEMVKATSTPDLTASFKAPASLPEATTQKISSQILKPI